MPNWNAFSFIFGPLVGFLVIALLVFVLRWAFARGGSLVEKPIRPSDAHDYGLMVSVASPETVIEGEILRRSLLDANIKATLAVTKQGPRVMVWPPDEANARVVLSRGPGATRG